MSVIPSHAQHSQVIQLVNSTINSNGSVSLSTTIVNIHREAVRPLSRTTGSSTSRIATRALALEREVKQLNSILHEALGLPQEFVALKETLDKLLETTIPRIIEFGSHGQTKLDNKLERHIDAIQVLVEAFMKNIWLEKLRLPASASASRSSVISLLWNQLWWIFSGRWDVNRLNEMLEKIRCRVHDILLHKSMAPSLKARILDQQIEIEDFFGARWFLPVHQCLDLTIFNLALQARFKGGSAEKVVTNGQFHAFKGSNIDRIDRFGWEEAIKLLVAEEDNIQLSVVVELRVDSWQDSSYHPIRCPRCQYKQVVWCDSGSRWADCTQCESRFSLTDNLNENATFHVRDLNGTRRGSTLDLNQLGGAPYKNYLITRETWFRIVDVTEEEGKWLDSILEALE